MIIDVRSAAEFESLSIRGSSNVLLPGVIGTGPTFSAVPTTCAMSEALSAVPWNRTAGEPTATATSNRIPTPSA